MPSQKQKVLDSHFHLFAVPHLENLAWMTPDNKLHGNHRLEEYKALAKADKFESAGAIFVETDIKSGLDESEWNLASQEYLYVERTVNKAQLEGEGDADGKDFIKAIIPWAPVPLGPVGLSKYIEQLKGKTVDKNNWKLVKGFRYLLQNEPKGTMLKPDFIDGLHWLAENNYVFDLGIDTHEFGNDQLEEFVQLDSKTKHVTYIVNHLCKPNFDIKPDEFEKLWSKISSNAANNYYIKFSGAFSELSLELARSEDLNAIADSILPWVEVFVKLFGPKNIIFGSDWPVSVLKFNEDENPWAKWCEIVDIISTKLNLDKNDVFYENSLKAYNI